MAEPENYPAPESATPESDRVPFHEPSIDDGEVEAALRVLRSGWLTTGSETQAFETEFADFLGVEHAVAVNSCTAALHLGLEAMSIGPGDKVLTTPLTFTATAEVVRYLGADPVFVDIDPATMNVSPEAVESGLRQNAGVKAIIPVHFAGLSCEMRAITDIAESNGCRILEDVAHALPARYDGRNVGLSGDAAAFSFYATKTVAVGEGGMLATDDAALASRARVMRLHGISRDVFDRYRSNKPSWYYEVVAPGFKYNLPDIAAAVGRVQLSRAESMRRQRAAIAARYDAAFAELPVTLPPHAAADDVHAWHLYVLRLDLDAISIDRDTFIEEMALRKIGTSVHFIPLHLQPYWRDTYALRPDQFPEATATFRQIVSLPLFPGMTGAHIDRVIEAVTDILEQASL